MRFSLNFDKMGEAFTELAKSQHQYAMSRLLNDGLYHVHKMNKAYMNSGVKGAIKGGPERYTNNAFRVKKGSKYNLRGTVYIQGGREYLDELLEGGTRFARNNKIPTPDSKQYNKVLNKRGNFRKNWLQNAMTEAMTARGANWTRLEQGRSKRKSMRGSPNNYFIQKFKNGTTVLKQRKAGEAIALVWFKDKSRKQRKTFYARERAQKNASEFFNKNAQDYLMVQTFNELMRRTDLNLRMRFR